jgi:hypothetical protein
VVIFTVANGLDARTIYDCGDVRSLSWHPSGRVLALAVRCGAVLLVDV